MNRDELRLLLKLEREAEAGNADSMVALGELYLKGACNETDTQNAYRWFEQASEKAHALGTARKADCLLAGLGVQRDVEEGHRLLLQAASEDDSGKKAQMLLSCIIQQEIR
jgi:TPR repeat protein